MNQEVILVKLGLLGTAFIEFEGTKTHMEISGNGEVKIVNGSDGERFNLSEGRQSGLNSTSNAVSNHLTKFEKIERYLESLYKSQLAGHDVHQEIEKALEQFRKEVGILE